MYAIAVHGGAGALPSKLVAPDERARYIEGLSQAIESGYDVLARGGSSVDAVVAAVRLLEENPLFNAGRGAALTRDGWAELDAAVMEGKEQRAGAVASVRHVKHPVELARRVMEKSRHVLLVGAGAEEFALEEGLPLVPNQYFRTEERRIQLASTQQGRTVSELMPTGRAPAGAAPDTPSPDPPPIGSQGTVGAVALDLHGNLAAATSTGGLTNKRQGRVGDSPIIGAGTYARNGVCAVSATGHGESFIRAVGAYHIACAVEFRRLSLEAAVRELVHSRIPALGGTGGVIAIGAQGEIVMDFNTAGMFRAARNASGHREIGIGRPD
jgi:beta-aspartyl-peptidase (threonine type)